MLRDEVFKAFLNHCRVKKVEGEYCADSAEEGDALCTLLADRLKAAKGEEIKSYDPSKRYKDGEDLWGEEFAIENDLRTSIFNHATQAHNERLEGLINELIPKE